ncbi:inter-alpha-trypsin inhibitor heavy chain H3-like isoform X5 [Salminus brasiliensis]|uniref:inter-alpha-trypsin inhibitor heavy chain H3-like isoform X5 n=1 Tax=Salminus brasiliensis TaxID=930266 RepID=UPI003B839A4C
MCQATVSVTLLGFLLISAIAAPTKKEDVEIYRFHINSTVTSRYAITVITSRVVNQHSESKEINFQVKIPKNAFISKFRMTIDGKTYDGVVKEKEAAQQQYSQAVARGESAGVVSSVGRTLEEFKTSVTVAANGKVTFELTYEELLKRRLGKYELLINAQPMQPVADFKIDVYIHEDPGISFLEVKGGLNTEELANAVTTTRSGKEAWVHFYPTREQQTMCKSCTETGLNGDLIITYDVERVNPNGDWKISNGYVAHWFAPMGIQQIPKNVVFVIDRSGSMHGRKMEQTRLAMQRILGDLASDDNFGLIIFDSHVDVWKQELLQATESNVNLAKSFVRRIEDQGATDINSAVLKGVEMINRHPREGSASILILLTDGAPNSGVSNPERIQANVKEAIGGKFALYCLGFGFDVNFDFLEKMALENGGLARRIYEDSDADLQLQGFYEEVATPLLHDLQLNYEGASNLTQTEFGLYYNGSEIVVAGEITDNSLESFKVEVVAFSKSKKVKYEETVSLRDLPEVPPQHENFTQRLWAYLTVKQLLRKELTLKGEEKEAAKKEALDLSLKYSFVTPLTSMVVTKPQESDTQVAHKPKEGEERGRCHDCLLVSQGRRGGPVGGGFHILAHSPPVFHPAHSPPMSHPGLPGLQAMPVRPGLPGLQAMPVRPGLPGLQAMPVRPGLQRERGISGISDYDYFFQIEPQSADFVTMNPRPTKISQFQMTSLPLPPANSVRFLISSSSQPKPLCYDIPLASKIRLLADPSSQFSMNGELTLYGGKGFKQIAIHYKTNHHLTISTSGINYSDGQNAVNFVWGQEPTKHEADSVSVILRNNEVDVTIGSVRVVFLLHKEDRDVFLWPAIRQQPKHGSLQGILAKTDVQYEKLLGSRIKINNQEESASLSTATDYRLHSAPSVECWLVRLQFALQGELSDFTVSQL